MPQPIDGDQCFAIILWTTVSVFKGRYCCGSQILRLSWQFSSGRCFQQYSKTTSIVLLYVIKLTVIQVWLFVFNYTTHSKCFSSYFVALIISPFSIILYADFYQSIFFAHFCNLIFKGFLKFFLSIYVQQIVLWTICLRDTDHYLKLIPRNNICCNELCTKYFESNFKILKLQKIPLDILPTCIEFD